MKRFVPAIVMAICSAIVVVEVQGQARSASPSSAGSRILVVPFDNVKREGRIFWLGEASAVLLTDDVNALGGDAVLEERDGATVIRGCGCPLASAVARRPETCRAVEALLSEVVGLPARQCCRHGDRPSCCFEVEDELSHSVARGGGAD